MSFLDFLSPALTTATQAAAAQETARAQSVQGERENLLLGVQLRKQQQQEAIQEAIRQRQQQSMDLQDRIREVQLQGAQRELTLPPKPTPWQPTTKEEYLEVHQQRPVGWQPRTKEEYLEVHPPSTPKPVQTTEGERKGAAFLHRITGVRQILNQFDNKDALDAVANKAGWFGNWAKSEEGQGLDNAAREWVLAVVRPESGATIRRDEMEQYYDTYIPRPGDKEVTLQRKRAARQRAEESIEILAGRAAPAASPGANIKAKYGLE